MEEAADSRSPRVLLGISGGVAAYKAPALARLLTKRGYAVNTILTRAAREFVTPLALESVTGNPCHSEMWSTEEGGLPSHVRHIGLARDCDLMLVAPATAHKLAELEQGLCPDLLTTAALALDDKPLVVCPSMNGHMWSNPATQENLETLRERGVEVVQPESGELACGEHGAGRLPELEQIVRRVDGLLEHNAELEGVHFLITAGGTREPIDPVRFVSNRASGRLGKLLAERALARGAEVTLVHTGLDLPDRERLESVAVETAEEMHRACLARTGYDVLVMTAAVSDFSPAPAEHKLRRAEVGDVLTVEMTRTPDILSDLAEHSGPEQILVGTAITTGDAVGEGREKLEERGLDGIASVQLSGGNGTGEELQVAVLWRDGGGDSAVRTLNRKRLADVLLDGITRRGDGSN